MKIRNRKALFLHSTILRGRRLKDGKEAGGAAAPVDDGMEVSPGFAEAAARMSGDDNRQAGETRTVEVDEETNTVAAGEGEGGEGEGGDGEGEGEEEKPKKRNTAAYVREVKRELKEERAARAALEARLTAIENGGLQKPAGDDNSATTRPAPDPNDATKYPLGVLDDGYIEDKIQWGIDQGIDKALNGRAETERAQAEQAQAEQHVATLRTKAESMADAGAELFDDYQETVVDTAMRGDWPITETTFTAAADATHGAEILYELAKNRAEAKRVSELAPLQQLRYILDKDTEIAAKRKGRSKPQAGQPPQNLPRGANASSAIRPDTDNLDDFRKIFYGKK